MQIPQPGLSAAYRRLDIAKGCTHDRTERDLCVCMTEVLGEKDGAPASALTSTDLVFLTCRDLCFGFVLLVQSISITTRLVRAEISQSNNDNRMFVFC